MYIYIQTQIYHIFIHTSVDRHFCYFHVLTTVNNAAVNMECRFLFQILTSVVSDICQEMKLLGHIIVLFYIFYEFSYCFLQWLHQFTFLTIVHKDFLFSTFSLTLGIYCLFDNSHSNRCKVISHCGFDLHFFLWQKVKKN